MPTFETPQPIRATIETAAAGHVLINASDRADTVVEVTPTNPSDGDDVRAADEARIDYANGRLLVTSPKKKRWRSLFGRPPSIDIVVELPSGSAVDANVWAEIRSEGRLGSTTIETAVGAVRLEETGPLKLRTAAGDVSVGRSVGHVDVRTATGKISIGRVEGSAAVKTSNGDVTLDEVTEDLRLRTSYGDITVTQALSSVDAKTAFGRIRVDEVVRGVVSLDTSFGDIDIGVREGTAAWLDMSSGSGGVRSHLEATDGPEPSDETVEVRAHTGFGDIVIRRSEPTTTEAVE